MRRAWPGLALAAAAVVLSFGLHWLLPVVPVMSFAVVLGILAANVPPTAAVIGGPARPGLDFCARTLMRAGIVLLGARLALSDLVELGWFALVLVVLVLLLAFAGTYLLARWHRLPGDQPVLLAAGFAICGASAIGAIAAARGSRAQDSLMPVALVTLCGTLAIGVLPAVMAVTGMPAEVFGFWAGASVHDVGQVVATAQSAGAAALTIAVVVKLARVVMLAPLAAGVAVHRRRTAKARPDEGVGSEGADAPRKQPPVVPLFVLGFLALVLLRSTGWLPQPVLDGTALVQEILLAAALFGLGSAVRVRELLRSSLPAISTALLSWLLIAGLGLGAAWLAMAAG
ncbi:putative sulfate exporter family transporter [Arthrobacter sp. CAU 1506]|nr:putative sulfate exporter family transporter [Arthrobacter sp. CAU 1506]TJY67679.1 putative sulfate exporter family transporter [Arthrobacter sp. CAU 1506]